MQDTSPSEIVDRRGREGCVLILPGVMNVTFYLAWLKRMIREAYPSYDVDARRWGLPLGWVANLRAYAQNQRTAQAIADELVAYRAQHPNAQIALVGYSGGGGLAVTIAAALPDPVTINRLLLIAPAISPEFPLVQRVLPKVTDFVVNYASRRDLQISLGTTIFGNMDRTKRAGAGAVGFSAQHPKLIQVHWHPGMRRYFHFGYHLSYLAPPWQRRYLLPALDPRMNPDSLRQGLLEKGVS